MDWLLPPSAGLTVGTAFVKHGPMPRAMQVEYPCVICHVMDRGDRREDIFRNDSERRLFLETLWQAFEKPVERGWCGDLRVLSLKSKV